MWLKDSGTETFVRKYLENGSASSVVMIIGSSDDQVKANKIINELMELDFSKLDMQNNLNLANDSSGLIGFGGNTSNGLDSSSTGGFGRSNSFGSASGGFIGSSGGGFGSKSSGGFGSARSSGLGTNSSSGFSNSTSGRFAGYRINCF